MKSTTSLHADHELERNQGIAPPLFQSVTYFAENEKEFSEMASEPLHDGFYGRYGNRNASRIARVIADLEHAEDGLMFASGMGAISNTVLSFVRAGDHIVAQKNHYIGTTKLLEEILPDFGVEVSLVEQDHPNNFARAMQDNTRLVLLESPVNPLLTLTDLEAVASLARSRGILTICDNTFATPILQQPIDLGIDLVIHSVTKYIGGHHDLIAGCVVGARELLKKIWSMNLVLGSVSAPFHSWLALRGIRTLDLRVRQHCRSALAIAGFLEKAPGVGKVYYPGLPSHPQRALVDKQMDGQGGGLLSFDLKGGYDAGVHFLKHLQIFQNAASLGGVDSLAIQPAVMWGGRLPQEVIEEQGLTPGLIRLAIGLEDTADLIRDLSQSLEKLDNR